MSTYPDASAFPLALSPDHSDVWADGLTKREHFAALAMQGLAASGQDLYATDVAQLAVMHADRLIAALNEEPQP